ncbi:hypothetical protein ZWY2020_046394 [Hordeum vulgare]|nr:hypothetical protein ZWY2020_046394 [Hordeum vulgare]
MINFTCTVLSRGAVRISHLAPKNQISDLRWLELLIRRRRCSLRRPAPSSRLPSRAATGDREREPAPPTTGLTQHRWIQIPFPTRAWPQAPFGSDRAQERNLAGVTSLLLISTAETTLKSSCSFCCIFPQGTSCMC